MTAQESGNQATVAERLRHELGLIKESIAGVHGSIVATSDGFLVSHDVPGLDPTDLAALLSATKAVTSQGITATGRGQFREAISRGTHGYLAVYAAGDSAIVAVIGDSELNIAMLHFRVRDIIDRIAGYTAEFKRWSSTPVRGSYARQADLPQLGPSGLPLRRRRSS